MMHLLRPAASLILMTGLLSQPAMAENPMKSIFSDMMTNSTSPTTFETAKRFGVSGGGFNARIPRVTPNIISVVPPKLNVGCGGIDFFTGSFSIINKDQMVQVMRGIANGAATYAFSVGMQAVCATCMSTLESLSDQLNRFNEFSQDACNASYKFLADKTLGDEGLNHFSEKSLFNPQAINLGIFSDMGEADTNKSNKAAIVAKASPDAIKDYEFNLVWDQLGKSTVQSWSIEGAQGYNWRELMQSLLGTVIVQVKAQGNDDAMIFSEPKPPTMTAMDLLRASRTIEVYKCGADTAKCMNPTKTQVHDWKGLAQTISERLQILHPTILARQEASLSPADQTFLNIVNAGFMNYLATVPVGTADANIELYSVIAANHVIASSIKGFVSRLKMWLGTNKSDQQARFVDGMNRAIDNLNTQMSELQDETIKAQSQLEHNFELQRRLTMNIGVSGK